MKDTWKVAASYHLIHSCALGFSALSLTGRKRNVCCGLFLGGIALFSGPCYLVVIMNERKPYSSVAPVGGLTLIAAWLALGFM